MSKALGSIASTTDKKEKELESAGAEGLVDMHFGTFFPLRA